MNTDSREIICEFASLMFKKLSHKEIMIFCISMLETELKLHLNNCVNISGKGVKEDAQMP